MELVDTPYGVSVPRDVADAIPDPVVFGRPYQPEPVEPVGLDGYNKIYIYSGRV